MDERVRALAALGTLWSLAENQLAPIDESNPLFPLLSGYLEESVIRKRHMLVAKLSKVSRKFTAPMLAGLNLEYPAIDRDLWRSYVRYCTECGFLPAARNESVV